jgi:hypothetical protein
MAVRRFPNDQQVDQWISTHFLDEADADASPVFDQLQAATADTVSRFQANAPGMVASGLGQWAALDIPTATAPRSAAPSGKSWPPKAPASCRCADTST